MPLQDALGDAGLHIPETKVLSELAEASTSVFKEAKHCGEILVRAELAWRTAVARAAGRASPVRCLAPSREGPNPEGVSCCFPPTRQV